MARPVPHARPSQGDPGKPRPLMGNVTGAILAPVSCTPEQVRALEASFANALVETRTLESVSYTHLTLPTILRV